MAMDIVNLSPQEIGESKTVEVFKSAVERTMGRGCLLCTRRAEAVGVWIPSKEYQDKVAAPSGKVRSIVYGLCKRCGKKSNLSGRVESKIIEDIEREKKTAN